MANKHWWHQYKVSVPVGESGVMVIDRFTVRENEMTQENMKALFNGQMPVPPGTWTRLYDLTNDYEMRVWMSDTPQEIADHLAVIKKIRMARPDARVLIHGLGLGMIVQFALRQPNVAHVDVVESSAAVIALVGEHYERMARREGKMLHIYHASCFDAIWKPHQWWDIVWHDIWPTTTQENLPEMHRLHRMFGRRCLWQGSWNRKQCEGMRAGTFTKPDPMEIIFGKKKALEMHAATLELMRRVKEENPNAVFI